LRVTGRILSVNLSARLDRFNRLDAAISLKWSSGRSVTDRTSAALVHEPGETHREAALSRALFVAIAVSMLATLVTIVVNHLVRTTVGPAHFWADLSRGAMFTSWLVVFMVWCTDRVLTNASGGWKTVGRKVDLMESHIDERFGVVEERLQAVEDVVEDLDHEHIQANAIVISIFKNRKSV
jgi:hypothetical protein